jgi:hypothetical protein
MVPGQDSLREQEEEEEEEEEELESLVATVMKAACSSLSDVAQALTRKGVAFKDLQRGRWRRSCS